MFNEENCLKADFKRQTEVRVLSVDEAILIYLTNDRRTHTARIFQKDLKISMKATLD